MATDVDKFKATIKKLLTQLRTWAKADGNIGQQRALDSYETKISMGMSIDCRGSIGLFIDGIYPFATHILEDNDQYFMNCELESDEEYNKLQKQLKEWWPAFSEERKDFVRKHIKLMVMLGAIIIRHEGLRQVINLYRDPSNPLLFK